MAGANKNASEDIDMLLANIEDLIDASEKGIASASCFVNPRERFFVQKRLERNGAVKRCTFWGGYDGAERCRLLVFPEFAQGMLEELRTEERIGYFTELSDETPVSIVEIRASGFKALSHRDYMGSILALGIERSAVGDIVVKENAAYIFASPIIAKYIEAELKKVGSDGVKVALTDTLPLGFTGGAQKEKISSTVSSPRLDAIAAALLNLSRNDAQELIRRGEAELNYTECAECDRTVYDGDVVSFRGYGKFRILSFGDLTRRGRIRLEAEKYK